MRKTSSFYFTLLALAGLIFITACGDDDESPTPGPSITLTPEDSENQESFTGFVGEQVSINVAVSSSEGFNVLRVYRQVDGVKGEPLEEFSRDPGSTQTELSADFIYQIGEDDKDKTIFLIFEAVDDAGNSSQVEYEIIAEVRPTKKYEMKLLYAPNSDNKSKTFFSTDDGEIYSVSDILSTAESVSPKIDFGYFYGVTQQATIASPVDYPIDYSLKGWDERNATKIRKTDLSEQQYIEVQTSEGLIDKAFEEAEEGTDAGRVSNLSVGDILAFELVSAKGNKRGLIKVNAIKGTTGTNDYIEIEVVVAE